MLEKPLISVVTVSCNAVTTIEQTILSVISQTYPNIEYIIIDGGSTDGTVDVIKKYADKIAYWVSEPDKGIYDAMNKGIAIATGEWINFMNSGDWFVNYHVISDIHFTPNYDIIYGDRYCLLDKRKFLQKPTLLENFKDDFPIFHQSTFTRTELLKKTPFDLEYKICADYNSFYNFWKRKYRFEYIEMAISICDCETGVSSVLSNEYQRLKENEYIRNERKFTWRFYIRMAIIFIKTSIKLCVDRVCHGKYKQYQLNRLLSKCRMYETTD